MDSKVLRCWKEEFYSVGPEKLYPIAVESSMERKLKTLKGDLAQQWSVHSA
jgi:hypothetical protein